MNNVPVINLGTFTEGKTVCVCFHLSPVTCLCAVHTHEKCFGSSRIVTCGESSFLLTHVECFECWLPDRLSRGSGGFQFPLISECCRACPCGGTVGNVGSVLCGRESKYPFPYHGDLKRQLATAHIWVWQSQLGTPQEVLWRRVSVILISLSLIRIEGGKTCHIPVSVYELGESVNITV